MTRAKERLIVSGSIDREKTADAIDADRLGARPSRRRRGARRGRRRAARDRAQRRAARRPRRPAPRRATRSQSAEAEAVADERGAARALRGARGGAAVPPAPQLPRARSRRPSRRCIASRRLSFTALVDVRPVLVQVLRDPRRRHARAAARAPRRRRRRAARDGDRRRGAPPARAGRPRCARACPTSSRCASGIRRSATRSSSGSAASSTSYCESELAARIARLTGRREGAALHVRAGRRAPARLPRRACISTARARSCSTTRRT